MNTNLNGTKELIFDAAVELISQKGYENVSLRDIAKKSGIKAASIYNHYSSKENLLDTIYSYFVAHRLDIRNPADQVKKTIECGTAFEIAYVLYDSAFIVEEKLAVRFILIYKILLMRIFNDPKAANIFLHEMYANDHDYLMKWLNYAVEIGRLDKGFDIETFARSYWRQLLMMGLLAFVNPEYVAKKADEEERIIGMLGEMLPIREPAS